MKVKYAALLLFALFCLSFGGCEKSSEPAEEEETENGFQTKKVQFYVDPAKFSRGTSGIVVSSVTINNKNYIPKTFVDQCTESYQINPATNEYDEYFMYIVNARNYNSLDAMMNGMEYSNETYRGIIYFKNLKNGCNTLRLTEGGGPQLFVLALE